MTDFGSKFVKVQCDHDKLDRLTCPVCKEPVNQKYARSILFADNLFYYHDECYIVFTDRLASFWDKLTSTEEEFETWLAEEDND